MRTSSVTRSTAETSIELELNLDGTGKADITTGVGFFDHMLTLLTKHALFDLKVKAKGDIQVDAHHTVEDIGICLGECLKKATGDKRGIKRYGSMLLPNGGSALPGSSGYFRTSSAGIQSSYSCRKMR